ncbi:MAG: protoporphyrinogen oxidase [Deltaproteobacteria bacterium]|nr:protoporphyrinogen oxidase [Deltaproteobacteria bacterium]
MITIVGGGISGLATALAIDDLARNERMPPPALQVLESTPRPGGKIRSEPEAEFLCEGGPNGFLDKEPKTFELCKRLDLEVLPATDFFENRYLYRGGTLHQVSMHPLQFMGSGLLPLSAKLRLAIEPFISAPNPFPEDESVASFARRRIGEQAFRILIDAMQSGIYAGDPERMSVVSCFRRVVEIEREYGSLIRGMVALMRKRKKGSPTPGAGPTGRLTSFPRGLQQLTDAMAQRLGDRLITNTPVQGVSRGEGGEGYVVHAEGGRDFPSDLVILACPAFAGASILRGLDEELTRLLRRIDYAPMAVASIAWRREQVEHPLDGFGFLAPRREGLRLLGALFTSSIFVQRAPKGHVLIRAMLGGARDENILQLDDEEILNAARHDLAQVLGLRGQPVMHRIFRHEHAIPQYNVGHGRLLQSLDDRLEAHQGLLLTGNAFRGIGVNDCIVDAGLMAQRALKALGV